MTSCLEIIASRRIFQNPASVRSITIFNFADIENAIISAPLLKLLNIATLEISYDNC